MPLQRWKLGSYELKYNPNTDQRELNSTTDLTETANGTISNPNIFFDDNIQFTIDLYNKPTYMKSPLRSFSINTYLSVTESSPVGNLFCLKSGGVDQISKLSGNIVGSFSLSLSGTPMCFTYMDDNIAFLYNDGTDTFVYITDESGVQISKYTITDTDYIKASSITWDGTSLYVLCKYGKIFTTDPTNGTTSMVCQFDDYTSNKLADKAVYKGIHIYNGYIGLIQGSTIAYYNGSFSRVFATDIQSSQITSNGIIDLSYGSSSGDFYFITSTDLVGLLPNTCGVDIDIIKGILSNGIAILTDEKGLARNTIIDSMDIRRLRNMQDARYQIQFSGKFV